MIKAYTVATLADRWDCSESIIRKLIAKKALHPFYLGSAIRIRSEEVERFECQTTASEDSGPDRPSFTSKTESVDVSALPRPIVSAPKRKRDSGGSAVRTLTGPWDA